MDKNITLSTRFSNESGLDVRVYDLRDYTEQPNIYYRFNDQEKAREEIGKAQKQYEVESNKFGGDWPPRLGYLTYVKNSGYYIDLCTAFVSSSLSGVKEASEEVGLKISHVIVSSKYIQEIQKEWDNVR